MRIYRSLFWLASALLIFYFAVRAASAPQWWSEVVVFNSIPILLIASLLTSKTQQDLHARTLLALSLAMWTLGSIASSIDTFFALNLGLIPELGYSTFYPFILLGLWKTFREEETTHPLSLLDILLIASGVATLATAIMIRTVEINLDGSAAEVALAIFYPASDLILLIFVLFISMAHKASTRNLYLASGVIVFVIADLYFLWQSLNDSYKFGALTDSLWLLGFILITQGFSYAESDVSARSISSSITSIALVSSGVVIILYLVQPGYFPPVSIVPAIVTAILASIKASNAMRAAYQFNEEQRLARTDELTGVANRRSFLAELDRFLERPGSLLILDLDGFKPINDALGHEAGDEALKQVARRFQRVMPREGLLARLGGDEFAALVPGDEGAEVARALGGALSYPVEVAGRSVNLGVSIGEALNQPGECDGEQLMRRADEAMYQAKRSRQGVLRWSSSIMR